MNEESKRPDFFGGNTCCPYPGKHEGGFTLIELLTVIAIIAILAAIIIPVTSRVRESANTATCTSQIRQIAIAMVTYAQDNGRLPMVGSPDWDRHRSEDWIHWQEHEGRDLTESAIAPYVGGEGTVVQRDFFTCPADEFTHTRHSWPSYQMNGRVSSNPGFPDPSFNEIRGRVHLIKNPTQVILVGEERDAAEEDERYIHIQDRAPRSTHLQPGNNQLTMRHNGKSNIAFVDGSVGMMSHEEAFEGGGQNNIHWDPLYAD